MNIGNAARLSGISAKMIRHYEALQLLLPAHRTEAGYRQYSENDVRTLQFIRRARDLGFSLDEIHELLNLWQDRDRPSREVKALAETHLEALERRVTELNAMKKTLQQLVRCCQGNERPDCPILESLAGTVNELPPDPAVLPQGAHRRVRNRTG